MGITINHYKDPYKTTNIMESKRVFSRGSYDLLQFHIEIDNMFAPFSCFDDSLKWYHSHMTFVLQ